MSVLRAVGWVFVVVAGLTGTVMVVGGMLEDLISIVRDAERRSSRHLHHR